MKPFIFDLDKDKFSRMEAYFDQSLHKTVKHLCNTLTKLELWNRAGVINNPGQRAIIKNEIFIELAQLQSLAERCSTTDIPAAMYNVLQYYRKEVDKAHRYMSFDNPKFAIESLREGLWSVCSAMDYPDFQNAKDRILKQTQQELGSAMTMHEL